MASNSLPKDKQPKYVFTQQLADKFTCIICTELLQNPRLTECCGQRYCHKCLQSWFESRSCQYTKSCPHCRTRNFAHISDKPIQREIQSIIVWCSHHDEGCEWAGKLEKLKNHLKACGYVEVECLYSTLNASKSTGSLTTKHLVRRNAYHEHLKQCPFRSYKCEYCNHEGAYTYITNQHYSICEAYPVICPNECGVRGVKRKDLQAHREQCQLERVKCPFWEEGCKFSSPRRDSQRYKSSHNYHHFELIHQKLQTKSEALIAMATLNKDLCWQIRQLGIENRNLQRFCRSLEYNNNIQSEENNELKEKIETLQTRIYVIATGLGLVLLWCIALTLTHQ